ncbi:hypothetical protein TTRE_0000805901 [Trichuris trichiura]|uniref:Uncharacterized protein n=1 Tax=Trichuris trichiura TaxID=36087 RepID=A0A077ZJ11_TRITR|nr:hypothetical protein TTRE_0000805901 [Trichuris trichiura]
MFEQTDVTAESVCSADMSTEVLLRELMALKELTELPQLVQTISCIESKDTPLANDLLDLCAQVVLPRLERSCEELVDTLRRVTLKRDQVNRRKPTVVTVEQAEALSKADQQEDKYMETAVISNMSSPLSVPPIYESSTALNTAEVEDSCNLKTISDFNYSEINSIGIQAVEKPCTFSYDEVICDTHFIGRLSLCRDELPQLRQHPSKHSLNENSAAVNANQLAKPCEGKVDNRVNLTLEMHDKAIYVKGNSQNMKISLDF